MKVIISDIHGNLAALEAVLADIEAKGIKDVACLGDIVGYGPQPRECIERCSSWLSQTTMGNHEEAALGGAERESFNPRARAAIAWTAQQIFGNPEEPEEVREERRRILAGLSSTVRDGEVLYLHASPRDPVHEYITPRDGANKKRMAGVFAKIPWVCFAGHTHHAGVFEESGFTPAKALIGGAYFLDLNKKALINVGSVGQPRDNDPRACYVTFDGEAVRFCRIEYDPTPTVARIRATPELDDSLGERLLKGV